MLQMILAFLFSVITIEDARWAMLAIVSTAVKKDWNRGPGSRAPQDFKTWRLLAAVYQPGCVGVQHMVLVPKSGVIGKRPVLQCTNLLLQGLTRWVIFTIFFLNLGDDSYLLSPRWFDFGHRDTNPMGMGFGRNQTRSRNQMLSSGARKRLRPRKHSDRKLPKTSLSVKFRVANALLVGSNPSELTDSKLGQSWP